MSKKAHKYHKGKKHAKGLKNKCSCPALRTKKLTPKQNQAIISLDHNERRHKPWSFAVEHRHNKRQKIDVATVSHSFRKSHGQRKDEVRHNQTSENRTQFVPYRKLFVGRHKEIAWHKEEDSQGVKHRQCIRRCKAIGIIDVVIAHDILTSDGASGAGWAGL